MRRNLGVGIAIVLALGLALVASNFTQAAGDSAARAATGPGANHPADRHVFLPPRTATSARAG
jgi:hypothetical protein